MQHFSLHSHHKITTTFSKKYFPFLNAFSVCILCTYGCNLKSMHPKNRKMLVENMKSKKKSSYPTFSLTQGDLLLYSESVYFPEQYIMRCDTFKTPKVMTILLVMHGFSFPVCWYFPCALCTCVPSCFLNLHETCGEGERPSVENNCGKIISMCC